MNAPEHDRKIEIVCQYGAEFGCSTLVETGTFMGGMIDGCRNRFARIESIESAPELAEAARVRSAGSSHITITTANSPDGLRALIPTLPTDTLYWLDAHSLFGSVGTDGTPVMQELEVILAADKWKVILIDDVRLFGVQPGWPALLDMALFIANATGKTGWITVPDGDGGFKFVLGTLPRIEMAEDILRVTR